MIAFNAISCLMLTRKSNYYKLLFCVLLDVADDSADAMEEELPPSQNIVDPPPPCHAESTTVAQQSSDTNQVTINQPFYGPSNQDATTMGNQAQTTNKGTGCTPKQKEMSTFSSDVYPPPPYTQHKVSTVAKAKGTYNNNEVKTTTTTTTKMTTTTTDISLQSELYTLESGFEGYFDDNFIGVIDGSGSVQPTIQDAQGTSSTIVEEALAPIPSPAPAVEEDLSPAKSRAVVVYSDRIQQRKDDLKNIKRSSAKKISDELKSSAEASRHKRRDQIVKEKRG
jgi:hypothetical protein